MNNLNQPVDFEFEQDFFGDSAVISDQPLTRPVRPVSEPQKNTYFEICQRKNITPIDITRFTFDQMDVEIKRVLAYIPVTQSQLDTIHTKIEILQSAGVNIPHLTDEFKAKLTGGRVGTASKLIAELIKLEDENKHKIPPDQRQLDILVTWFLCPDIPFEEFGIEKKVLIEGQAWRYMTKTEFMLEIKSKMNHGEASKFMDDYGSIALEWRKTRLSKSQRDLIKRLETDLCTLKTPTIVEMSVDLEGHIIPVEKHIVDKTKMETVRAHAPLNDYQLLQFSYKQADMYIRLLQKEQRNKEHIRYGETSDGSETFEEIRKLKTIKDVKENEFKIIQDLIFGFEQITGYQDEDVHEAVVSLLIDEEQVTFLEKNRTKIREYMIGMIERGDITFQGLADMISKSGVMVKILIER